MVKQFYECVSCTMRADDMNNLDDDIIASHNPISALYIALTKGGFCTYTFATS